MDWSPPGSSVHGILQVSHIEGRFFTIWATQEDLIEMRPNVQQGKYS